MAGLRTAPKRKAPMRKRTTRKTASVAKRVQTLAKAVKKLNTISYDKVQLRGIGNTNQGIVEPYYIYHVNNLFNTWTPLFGYDAADFALANKCYVNSYKVDARISQDNEPDLIWYSAFVVSLKDDAADSTTFDPATGSLTLANPNHYITMGAQGKVFVNQRVFNIHAYKRFSMGGRVGDQSNPTQRDLSFTIKPKQKLITNPKGNVFGVGGLSFPKDPSKNYYLILFNDDVGADLQTNKITVNVMANCAIPN